MQPFQFKLHVLGISPDSSPESSLSETSDSLEVSDDVDSNVGLSSLESTL